MTSHYHMNRLARLQKQAPRKQRQDVHMATGKKEGPKGLEWEEGVRYPASGLLLNSATRGQWRVGWPGSSKTGQET